MQFMPRVLSIHECQITLDYFFSNMNHFNKFESVDIERQKNIKGLARDFKSNKDDGFNIAFPNSFFKAIFILNYNHTFFRSFTFDEKCIFLIEFFDKTFKVLQVLSKENRTQQLKNILGIQDTEKIKIIIHLEQLYYKKFYFQKEQTQKK